MIFSRLICKDECPFSDTYFKNGHSALTVYPLAIKALRLWHGYCL